MINFLHIVVVAFECSCVEFFLLNLTSLCFKTWSFVLRHIETLSPTFENWGFLLVQAALSPWCWSDTLRFIRTWWLCSLTNPSRILIGPIKLRLNSALLLLWSNLGSEIILGSWQRPVSFWCCCSSLLYSLVKVYMLTNSASIPSLLNLSLSLSFLFLLLVRYLCD